MRVFVVGSTGQLGRALLNELGGRAVGAGGRSALDVRDAAAVDRAVREAQPDVVVNASAYNKVDGAETEPLEAFAVNATGALHLARSATACRARFIHVSTDYVFDGTASRPYVEKDRPQPINAYGTSKLAGEHLVQAVGSDRPLIVRTSAVFGYGGSRDKGGSFVDRILDRARRGEPLRIVNDQTFSPTYAPDLARAIVSLIETDASGIVHVANGGACTWHDLAMAALAESGVSALVEAIRSEQLPHAARRPAYSVLSTERYRSDPRRAALRPWRDALREFLSA